MSKSETPFVIRLDANPPIPYGFVARVGLVVVAITSVVLVGLYAFPHRRIQTMPFKTAQKYTRTLFTQPENLFWESSVAISNGTGEWSHYLAWKSASPLRLGDSLAYEFCGQGIEASSRRDCSLRQEPLEKLVWSYGPHGIMPFCPYFRDVDAQFEAAQWGSSMDQFTLYRSADQRFYCLERMKF